MCNQVAARVHGSEHKSSTGRAQQGINDKGHKKSRYIIHIDQTVSLYRSNPRLLLFIPKDYASVLTFYGTHLLDD